MTRQFNPLLKPTLKLLNVVSRRRKMEIDLNELIFSNH